MNKTKSFRSPKSGHVNSETKKLLKPSYNPRAYRCSCLCVTVSGQKILTQIHKLLQKKKIGKLLIKRTFSAKHKFCELHWA